MELDTKTYRTIVSNENVWLYMHVIDTETNHLKTYGLSYWPEDDKFEWDGRQDDVLEDYENGDHVFTGDEELEFSRVADLALDEFISELDTPTDLHDLGVEGQFFSENLLPTDERFSAYLCFEYEP